MRMIRILRKRRRLRLELHAYSELRQQVLQRDRWRCQRCGTASPLQVHHIQSRGRQGDDGEENLITLCATCHQDAHRR